MSTPTLTRLVAIVSLSLLMALHSLPATRATAAETDANGDSGGDARDALESLSSDEPALISAEQITYDHELGLVTASGDVEISQGQRVLMADTVSYNLNSNVVTASGNVSLLEPDGNVVFADFVELTDDLREGFIRDIRVLLTDNSRLAAASGVRTGANRTEFRRTVFSPCELCREDPERAPLWQIKAEQVVHDQEERMIRYRNAWMEFFGVPIVYTPYFEHPDPTVERKSGFLAPTVGVNTNLGVTVETPYYWTLSPALDFTFEPIFTTKQNVVLAGEYRQLFTFGEHIIEGSGTIADRENDDGTISKDVVRGHIDAVGRYDINDRWRAGYNIARSSDDTYLRLYNFSNAAVLTSNAFAEGFDGRSYVALNNYAYQGLRAEDDNDEAPFVAPIFDVNYMSEPGFANSRYGLNFNAMMLNRVEGRDTRRLSLNSDWTVPFMDPIGGLYSFTANLQTDGYYTTNFVPGDPSVDPTGPTESEFAGRFFPQAALNWRYPWMSQTDFVTQVFQPIAQVVVGPNGGNPSDIPNEDSNDFQFDDTNLYALNRFTGLDRVDSGQRIDYGVEWSGDFYNGGNISTFVGQSYRFSGENDEFPTNSGLEENLSDIVGRVSLSPIDYFNVLYRFRLDNTEFTARRNELDANIGPPALNLRLNYLFIDASLEDETEPEDREEINMTLSTRVNENWAFAASALRDLEANKMLEASLGVTYSDECIIIETVGGRSFFRDRDLEPDDFVIFRVVFKHLGEISAN